MKTQLMQKIAKDLEKATDKPVTKPEGSGKVGKDLEAVSDKPANKEANKVTAKDDKKNEHMTDKSREAEDNELVSAIKRSLQYRIEQLKRVEGEAEKGVGTIVDTVSKATGDVGHKVKEGVENAGKKAKEFVQKNASRQSFLSGYMSKFSANDDEKPSLAGDIGIGAGGLAVGNVAHSGVGAGQRALAGVVSENAGNSIASVNKHLADAWANPNIDKRMQAIPEHLSERTKIADAALAGELHDYRPIAALGMELPKIPVGVSKGLRYGALGVPMAVAAYLIARRHADK